jgi:hypothetical protein
LCSVVQGLALGGVVLVSLSLTPAAGASEKLAITSAVWKAEKAELRIEGLSKHVDAVVLVRDADSRKLIGSAAVRADGKWMLKIRNPNFVPSRTRADCEGAGDECAVTTVAAAAPAPLAQAGPGSPQ